MGDVTSYGLSKAGYYADFKLAPVYALLAAVFEVMRTGLSLAFFAWIVAGFAAWTLVEYLLHRFVFHLLLREEHWLHHIRPAAFIGVQSWKMAIVFGLAWLFLVSMFGMTRGAGGFVGLMFGYYAYIWAHDAIHHRRISRGHWLRPCFDRHALHHSGVECNFGVITPFWDIVFRTYVGV